MAGFVSDLGKMRVYDDNNAYLLAGDVTVNGKKMSRGRIPRDFKKQPIVGYSKPFSRELIPRSEWDDRIEEKQRLKTRLTDICDQAGLTVKDQNGLSYCWVFATTHGVEVARVVQGQPMVRLSPSSVGAKIKNFRNEGGWGTEALEYIVEHGVVSQDKWPECSLDRKYDNDDNDADRKRHQVQEWDLLDEGDFDALATACLVNDPTSIGLSWWSHQVLAMDLVSFGNKKYGITIDNSWGTGWEDNGRGVLTQSKATPDDACIPRTTTPS